MSDKNFVSYGDAETLMSGIKDAIDGAGGGASVRKIIIASVTDTSLTVGEAILSLRNALRSYWSTNHITTDDAKNAFLRNTTIYASGTGATAPYKDNAVYRYMGNGCDNPLWGLVCMGESANNGYIASIFFSGNASSCYFFHNGTQFQTNTMSFEGITKLELVYQELVEGNNALVDQVAEIQSYVNNIKQHGEYIKAETYSSVSTTSSMTFKQALNNIALNDVSKWSSFSRNSIRIMCGAIRIGYSGVSVNPTIPPLVLRGAYAIQDANNPNTTFDVVFTLCDLSGTSPVIYKMVVSEVLNKCSFTKLTQNTVTDFSDTICLNEYISSIALFASYMKT